MLAACGGGGGGSGAFGPTLSVAQQANVVTASQAGLAASQSQTANASVSTALSNLSNLVSLNPTLSSNSTVTAAALTAQQAANLATSAQTSAAAAAADLMVASNVNIVGVVSAGRTICAATNSCTSAEIAALGYIAANTAKNAAEATLFALNATNQLKDIISTVAPTVNLTAATAAIATATSSASSAQSTANTTITNYAAAAIQVGAPVITITLSSGTTGSVEGTPTYNGNTQTIVTTFGNGQTATVTNQPTSSAVTWGSDNVTRTTTHTFANGGTNAVVDTVPGTVGTPTYSGATQTIVTTFGNGQTSTVTNAATGTPVVTWGSDNVTRTTTYTFANGGTNAVVDTVPGIETGGVSTTINGIVSITPITIQYGSGVTVSSQDGTVLKPFIQSTLSSKNISDSNSFIQSSTDTYDLRWGVKASSFSMSTSNNVSAQTSSTLGLINLNGVYLGNYGTFLLNENFSFTSSLSSTTDGLQGTWITQDVKDAWYAGWSGKGIKIGVIDDFTANSISDYINLPLNTGCSTRNIQSIQISTCSNSNNIMIQATHGEQVAMIAGSSLSSLTGLMTESGGWSDGFDLGSYNVVKNLNINFSSPFYGVAKDATIYRDDFLTYQSNTLGLFSVLKNWSLGSDSSSNLFKNLHVLNMSLGGTSTNRVNNQSVYSNQLSYANSSVVPDVVFVKAAGNSSCVINQTNCDPLNAVLYNSPNYKNKSLIVGALDRAGGTIASYSNKAGAYSDIFLVADGRGLFNSTSNSYVEGTSFAAPRVSGYTAILRHKFPNLNAEKSASIMLDTARYDTMGCHPNCDPSIYGKGEASLSRALAPVGRLR